VISECARACKQNRKGPESTQHRKVPVPANTVWTLTDFEESYRLHDVQEGIRVQKTRDPLVEILTPAHIRPFLSYIAAEGNLWRM